MNPFTSYQVRCRQTVFVSEISYLMQQPTVCGKHKNIDMINIDDMSEEFKERTKALQRHLNEPYRKYLTQRQSELFHNPDCN